MSGELLSTDPQAGVPKSGAFLSADPGAGQAPPVTTVKAGTQYTVGPDGKLIEATQVPHPSLWQRANTPLLPQIEDAANAIADHIDHPRPDRTVLQAEVAGALAGATQGAGKLAAGYTSPVGIALTLAGLGETSYVSKIPGMSTLLRIPAVKTLQRAVLGASGVGFGAEGVGTMAQGAGERDLGKMGQGLVETATGALALHGATGPMLNSYLQRRATNTNPTLDFTRAVPPSTSARYDLEHYQRARPYLEAEHQTAPITNVETLRDAGDAAISKIEQHIDGYLQAFGNDRLRVQPLEEVVKRLSNSPRGEFLNKGLDELTDLGLDRPLTLNQAEAIRRQLNAENKAAMKKNNYDRATARKADPGFAAREAAVDAIRDGIYSQLEARGVPNVDELRRDEGAVIALRNAAERQIYSGQHRVSETKPSSVTRRAIGAVVRRGGAAIGAVVGGDTGAVVGSRVGEHLSDTIQGKPLTRDQLVARSFERSTTSPPKYPRVPPAPQIRGLIGQGPITPAPPPDASFVRSVEGVYPPGRPRLALPPARRVIITPPPADTSFVRGVPAEYGARVSPEEANATQASRAQEVPQPAPPRAQPPRRAQRSPVLGEESSTAPYVDGDVIAHVVKRAQESGAASSPAALKARASELYDAMREIDRAYESEGIGGKPLLRFIAKIGGLSILKESENKGELAWLKDARKGDSYGGIGGVFRDANGKSWDGVLEALNADPQFAGHYRTIEDVRAAVEDAGNIGKNPEPKRVAERFIKSLGPDWWKHLEPPPPGELAGPEEGDTSFEPDKLDTGEAQPRLPGAGQARDQNIATPHVAEAPFSLTAHVAQSKGIEGDLLKGAAETPIAYFKGDAGEYTGVVKQLHGGTFYEIKMLEGAAKGQKKLILQSPERRHAIDQANRLREKKRD